MATDHGHRERLVTTPELEKSPAATHLIRAPRTRVIFVAGLVVAAVAMAAYLSGKNGPLGDGYWTTPIPSDAPVDANSDEMIAYLKGHSTTNYIRLAGASNRGKWGMPIYYVGEGDPTYEIDNSCDSHRPPEFASVRIPRGARADPSSDSAMTVYDLDRGVVYGLYEARFDDAADRWSACGGTVYYLESNGIVGSLATSDEPRNYGHRGVPPFIFAVRYDEIQAGSIDHVLKIAIGTAHEDHVWPMTGSDGNSTDEFAPPEGARLRLRPSIDLDELDLTDAQQTIAAALQKYGAVIGDQSGSTTVLKLENTVAEGRGQLWAGVLGPDSLSVFELEDFEVIELGYGS
jgi:hypothetical protein